MLINYDLERYSILFQTWVSAVLVSIWSSGIGFGVLILYGSLCPFRNPSNTDSVIVSLTSIASSSSVTLFAFACGGSMSNLHGLAPAYLHEGKIIFIGSFCYRYHYIDARPSYEDENILGLCQIER